MTVREDLDYFDAVNAHGRGPWYVTPTGDVRGNPYHYAWGKTKNGWKNPLDRVDACWVTLASNAIYALTQGYRALLDMCAESDTLSSESVEGLIAAVAGVRWDDVSAVDEVAVTSEDPDGGPALEVSISFHDVHYGIQGSK